MVVALASCSAEPTQVRVRIRTTVPCAQLNGVAINAGSDPAAVEERVKLGFTDATTDKSQCDAEGEIGTVYLLPGKSRASLVVRAGYGTQKATECTADNGYKGCIVARRSISYLDRTTLSITIELDPDCLDVPCGLLSTCSKGQCVSSEAVCKGNECNPDPAARVPGDERPGTDAGGVDSGGTTDGGEEAGTGTDSGLAGDAGQPDGGAFPDAADGSAPIDAGGDAPFTPADGGTGTPGRVRCRFFDNDQIALSADAMQLCAPAQRCTAMMGDPSGSCDGPFDDGLNLMCTRSSECPLGKECWLKGSVVPNGAPLITTCHPVGLVVAEHVRVCEPGGAVCPNCVFVPYGPGFPPKPILYACQ